GSTRSGPSERRSHNRRRSLRDAPVAANRAPRGQRQRAGHDRGQDRPRVPAEMDGEDRRGDSEHHHNGDPPVVADHEVVPEPGEPREPLHAVTAGADVAPRIQDAIASENAANTATRTSRDASPPGHATPAPSPLQNTPNDVSMTPTPNFNEFSGTRESGAWT